jgi:hypothetical protein
MAFQAMTMMLLTHPLHALLMGMIVLHGARALQATVRRRRAGHGSDGPVTAGVLDLRAAV